MDPVCLVCLHELIPSNHNSPFLFCHLLHTVSVNIFAGPKPGPKGLDSVMVKNPSNYLGVICRGTVQAGGLTPGAGSPAPGRPVPAPVQRRGGGAQKGPVHLPCRAQPAAAQAGGKPPHSPWNQGHIPCFIFPPNRATGTSQPVALLKTGSCQSQQAAWAGACCRSQARDGLQGLELRASPGDDLVLTLLGRDRLK